MQKWMCVVEFAGTRKETVRQCTGLGVLSWWGFWQRCTIQSMQHWSHAKQLSDLLSHGSLHNDPPFKGTDRLIQLLCPISIYVWFVCKWFSNILWFSADNNDITKGIITCVCTGSHVISNACKISINIYCKHELYCIELHCFAELPIVSKKRPNSRKKERSGLRSR